MLRAFMQDSRYDQLGGYDDMSSSEISGVAGNKRLLFPSPGDRRVYGRVFAKSGEGRDVEGRGAEGSEKGVELPHLEGLGSVEVLRAPSRGGLLSSHRRPGPPSYPGGSIDPEIHHRETAE